MNHQHPPRQPESHPMRMFTLYATIAFFAVLVYGLALWKLYELIH